MSVPDPYKVLQVDSEAEFEVIEAAYRRLARKYHPDVSPGPESQERMVRINQAWELLRDPVKRAAVDRARTRNAGSAAQSASTDARTAAAEARRAAASQAPTPPGTTYEADTRYTTTPVTRAQARARRRGLPGPAPGPKPDYVSPDWTTGRSHAGGGFDASTMSAANGVGSAGPPPGNPRGAS